MKTEPISGCCLTRNLSRRRFLTATCAACMALGHASLVSALPSPDSRKKKLKIALLYSLSGPVHNSPRAWPNIGYDFTPAMEQITASLIRKFPDMEFHPAMAAGPEEAEKIVASHAGAPPDGYIVYQMELWNKVVQTVAQTGKPLLYVDFAYGGSGGFQRYIAAFLREDRHNVGFVSSFRPGDLFDAVKCFRIIPKGATPADFATAVKLARMHSTPHFRNRKLNPDPVTVITPEECIRRLGESKILAVRDQKGAPGEPVMGIPLEYIPFSEVDEAWRLADREEARELAARWSREASGIIDVTQETLVSSAAMYAGMKSVMQRHGANAITINCLGGFTGEFIHAYPCLGFRELVNEGLVGACECDIRSTATMLAFSTLTNGRPGFISDPVIDTSTRQVVYAHCVAPTKVFGPQGASNPWTIMTHSEDRKGASVRSILPLNYMTTTLEIRNAEKEILLHQAVAVGNSSDDRACRTKLCGEVKGNMEKIFTQWDQWGWHRVTFYGDLKEHVYGLADAMGWKVIEEA